MQKNHPFFEQLFRQYHRPLVSYAYVYVRNMEAAEDIVQDVFLDAWKRKNLVLDNNIKAYLFRATYTRSLNFLANKNNNTLRMDSIEQRLEVYLRTSSEFEESLFSSELQREIQLSVESLPEQCQRIFQLRRMYDLKNTEVAEQLGISVKAVEKQITKALQHIRLHLRRRGYL